VKKRKLSKQELREGVPFVRSSVMTQISNMPDIPPEIQEMLRILVGLMSDESLIAVYTARGAAAHTIVHQQLMLHMQEIADTYNAQQHRTDDIVH